MLELRQIKNFTLPASIGDRGDVECYLQAIVNFYSENNGFVGRTYIG